MTPFHFRIIGGAVVLSCALALAISGRSECSLVAGGGDVAIDTSSIPRGTAREFCYTDRAGARLRFVLARDSRGVIRTVFDACKQCFTYHRGFKIENGEMICRVCGTRYSIDHMDRGKASCVPAPLEHREAAGKVHISGADLAAGAEYF